METLKSTLKEKEEQWDRYLNQSSLFCKAERVTSIPKVYLSLAFASVVFLLLFLNVAGQLLSNLIGWVYPGK
jgi:receptor expression-enhancing protein 5/6